MSNPFKFDLLDDEDMKVRSSIASFGSQSTTTPGYAPWSSSKVMEQVEAMAGRMAMSTRQADAATAPVVPGNSRQLWTSSQRYDARAQAREKLVDGRNQPFADRGVRRALRIDGTAPQSTASRPMGLTPSSTWNSQFQRGAGGANPEYSQRGSLMDTSRTTALSPRPNPMVMTNDQWRTTFAKPQPTNRNISDLPTSYTKLKEKYYA